MDVNSQLVTHIVSLTTPAALPATILWQGFTILAVYLDQHGSQIGYLLQSGDGSIISMDPDYYFEYLEELAPPIPHPTTARAN